jgi:curved DNA-binding protein CbpA
MAERSRDPYQTLGLNANASEDEVRAAYRRLVQLHHPDHNGGSAESARRFEAVQEAYAQIKRARPAAPRSAANRSRPGPPPASVDPDVESRLADLERELRQAHLARENARRAARRVAAQSAQRPSDEELGYVTTDDSFSKILSDAAAELSDRFAQARDHPAARRVSDLIDDLESKLTGEPPT